MESLVLALQKTLCPDQVQIRQAEEILQKMEGSSGYVVALLQVMMAKDSLEQGIRHAASIQFKNLIKRLWTADPPNTLSDTDKAFVKQHILEAVCRAERLIRKQLTVSISLIAFTDFPDQWPELLSGIVSLLSASEPQSIFGSLASLRALMTNFEFVHKVDKEMTRALNLVSGQTFPLVERLLVAAANSSTPTSETLYVQRAALKILLSSTNVSTPKYFMNAQVVERWINFAISIIARSTAPVVSQQLQEAWWKCAHSSSDLLLRWLLRYGKSSDTKTVMLKKAMKPFQMTLASSAASAFLALLSKRNEVNAPERAVYEALSYIANTTLYTHVFKTVRPHCLDLVQHVCFPLLCASQEDFLAADKEPTEYLRKEFDSIDLFLTPRSGAINFIGNLAKFRPKHTLLPIMQFVSQILQQTTATPNPAMKFGALVLVTAIDIKLKKTEPFKSQLQAMISTFVLPELNSQHTIMRAMAVWTFARFCDIEWTDGGATFAAGLERTLQLTADQSHLTSAVFAALSLKHLVQVPIGMELMKPHIGNILELYYKLIDRTDLDLDDLVMAIEVFVDMYGESLAPHAFGICKHLAEAYMQIVTNLSQNGDGSEDEDGLILKASGCLDTLSTILTAVHGIQDLFKPLGLALIPLIQFTLSAENLCQDFLSDALNILQLLTFWTMPLPNEYWVLFPLIPRAFDLYAEDYIADMLPALDNYISRGKEMFLSNPENLKLIFVMLRKSIGDPAYDELDCLKACQIAEVVFHHCKGQVDEFAVAVIGLAIERLKVVRSTALKILLIEIIANGLYYNPLLTLKTLESIQGAIELAFKVWHEKREEFVRPYDKKISILALSSIFMVQSDLIPAMIRDNLIGIITDTLYFLKDLEKQNKAIEREEKKFRAREEAKKAGKPIPRFDDDDDADEKDGDDDDDENDERQRKMNEEDEKKADEGIDSDEEIEVDDGGDEEGEEEEEEEYDDDGDDPQDTLISLAEQAAEARDLDEEDGMDEFLELDDEDVDTPVNYVDEITFFIQVAQSCVEGQMKSALYHSLFTNLPNKLQSQIQKWINVARDRQNKRLQQPPSQPQSKP